MNIYIKYGVSVAALLATLALAQAQSEHQGGGEKGGEAVQHAQPERGKEGSAKERAPAAQERGKGETHASPANEKQPAEHRAGERSVQERAPAAQEHSKGETRASPANEKQPAEHRAGERSVRRLLLRSTARVKPAQAPQMRNNRRSTAKANRRPKTGKTISGNRTPRAPPPAGPIFTSVAFKRTGSTTPSAAAWRSAIITLPKFTLPLGSELESRTMSYFSTRPCNLSTSTRSSAGTRLWCSTT